ncbi:MAG: ribosomal RNA small subunit methyltransferase A [Thermogemmatispora sp.]|nr:ribosomal RNA small subunit methyltransferase A [Thermogemmatispora sp.]
MRPLKSFGQHFLVDRGVLTRIVAAAALEPSDNVLEVGAGTGVLTRELARRAGRVVAVELERSMLRLLAETTAPFSNIEIVAQNLLTVDPQALFGHQPYKLVANLPYYITAPTFRHFLESEHPPSLIVVMIQYEVAQRIVATPGDLSLLGISVQFFGRPQLIARVPARAFYPPPRVDSAIVRVEVQPRTALTTAERASFFRLVQAGFAERRKQLHNALTRGLGLPAETVHLWLRQAGIAPERRAETLSLDEWLQLWRTLPSDASGFAKETVPPEAPCSGPGKSDQSSA